MKSGKENNRIMKKRKWLMCLMAITIILCTACGKEAETSDSNVAPAPTEATEDQGQNTATAEDDTKNSAPVEENETGSTPEEGNISATEEEKGPTTNEELFKFVTDSWKNRETDTLYEYSSADFQALMGKEDFAGVFESLSVIGGELLEVSEVEVMPYMGIDVYTSVIKFENITLDLQLVLNNVEITGLVYQIHFNDTFEVKYENGIVERYFVFENDGYELNAVYTYLDDGEKHPATLLIAGSGVTDYNESVGNLAIFQDIAFGLAQRGVNSLRLDKRTLGIEPGTIVGLEEEYFSDCRAAIDFLKAQDITDIYLLGHSLGGQIAPKLAVEDSQIAGMILFNSTPRHLADVACDQYIVQDTLNKELYMKYAEAAKAVREDTVQGAYYFGMDDYYWATYNSLDVVADINNANIRTLIINSTNDAQIFEVDRDEWYANLAENDNVTIHVYDDMSHFGYKIDVTDNAAFYKKVDFPKELLDEFAAFCE